jgi:excisionase family DNA binding protein
VSNNETTPPVLTIADIMARWRCGRRAVLERIHEGKLRAWHVGRAWRVSLAELERFERQEAA